MRIRDRFDRARVAHAMASGLWGKTAFLSVQSCAARGFLRDDAVGDDRGDVFCASIVAFAGCLHIIVLRPLLRFPSSNLNQRFPLGSRLFRREEFHREGRASDGRDRLEGQRVLGVSSDEKPAHAPRLHELVRPAIGKLPINQEGRRGGIRGRTRGAVSAVRYARLRNARARSARLNPKVKPADRLALSTASPPPPPIAPDPCGSCAPRSLPRHADLAVHLVHVDAYTLHGWPPSPCGFDRASELWSFPATTLERGPAASSHLSSGSPAGR